MEAFAADPAGARITLELDGLTLVYHRPSRSTHLLDSPAPELLDALGEGPADAALLAERLARTHELVGEAGADAISAISERLAELATAGLVWRAHP